MKLFPRPIWRMTPLRHGLSVKDGEYQRQIERQQRLLWAVREMELGHEVVFLPRRRHSDRQAG